MNESHVLIVDDEPDILELLEITLTRMDITCACATDISSAKDLLNNNHFGLCLSDMHLPDGNGLDLVSFVQEHNPDMPIAIITAHGNMETAIAALKNGAFDFLTKPIDLDVLRKLVNSALYLDSKSTTPEIQIIGKSHTIESVREKIIKLSRSQAPVYISGESGTGKELAALLIHANGPRANKPFIPVNCSAIPHELLESELFGHKKGSFTGALNDKDGLFQAANGGTLFLDEIADLPLNMQVKMLRAIQEKRIRPVGSNKEIPLDVRILCATHKNLNEMVINNEFRQDLYYRINVIELCIPPLRERKEDIPLLVEYILNKMADVPVNKRCLSEKAKKALENYLFPGNIRELENILERALTLCNEGLIEEEDLQLPQNEITNVAANKSDVNGLDHYIEDLEREKILNALEETKWNKTAAAKKLGISFRALRYRLEKLHLK